MEYEEKEVRKWMLNAGRFQQAMFVRLGDRKWDAIPANNRSILERKVGYALFGEPQSAPDSNNNNTGYDKDQLGAIDKICNILTERADKIQGQICIACIFVLRHRERRPIPILKVLCPNGLELFISLYNWHLDTIGQKCAVYEGFHKLLRELFNFIRDIDYEDALCFPIDGTYTGLDGKVRLGSITSRISMEFGVQLSVGGADLVDAPANSPPREQLVTKTDPQLQRLDLHELAEGLDLTQVLSSEPDNFGNANSIEKARELLPTESSLLQPTDMAAVNFAFSIASDSGNSEGNDRQVSLAGLMTLRDIVRIAENVNNNNSGPSELDCLKFASSFLFYTNRLVEQNTVTNILSDALTELITSHEKSPSPEEKGVYDELVKPLRGEGNLHGDAKLLRQVIRIRNKDLFYDHLLDQGRRITGGHGDAHEIRFSDSAPGLINIDGAISLHPYKLSFLTAEDMEEFLNICAKLKAGTIVEGEFKSQIQDICKKYKLHFDFEIAANKEKLSGLIYNETKFHDLEINGIKIFNNMDLYVVNRLAEILNSKDCRWEPKIFDATMKLAISQGISKPQHFCCLLEYVSRSYLQEIDEAVRNRYQVALRDAKQSKAPELYVQKAGKTKFGLAKFNMAYLGTEKLTKFSRRKALDEIGTDAAVEEMNKRFDEAKKKAWDLNLKLEVGFSDEYTAAYHAILHRRWGQTLISLENYFEIVKGLFSIKKEEPDGVDQYGEYVYFECYDASNGAFGVIYHFFDESSYKTKKIMSTVHRKAEDVRGSNPQVL